MTGQFGFVNLSVALFKAPSVVLCSLFCLEALRGENSCPLDLFFYSLRSKIKLIVFLSLDPSLCG